MHVVDVIILVKVEWALVFDQLSPLMPLTAGATANPNFSVNFCSRDYAVDSVLQKRPIAIVLAISRGSWRPVIKVVSSHL